MQRVASTCNFYFSFRAAHSFNVLSNSHILATIQFTFHSYTSSFVSLPPWKSADGFHLQLWDKQEWVSQLCMLCSKTMTPVCTGHHSQALARLSAIFVFVRLFHCIQFNITSLRTISTSTFKMKWNKIIYSRLLSDRSSTTQLNCATNLKSQGALGTCFHDSYPPSVLLCFSYTVKSVKQRKSKLKSFFCCHCPSFAPTAAA